MSIIEESQLIKGLISAAYHELKNNASTSTEPWYERPEYSEIVDRWTSLANRTLIDDNVDVHTIADVLVSGWFLLVLKNYLKNFPSVETNFVLKTHLMM